MPSTTSCVGISADACATADKNRSPLESTRMRSFHVGSSSSLPTICFRIDSYHWGPLSSPNTRVDLIHRLIVRPYKGSLSRRQNQSHHHLSSCNIRANSIPLHSITLTSVLCESNNILTGSRRKHWQPRKLGSFSPRKAIVVTSPLSGRNPTSLRYRMPNLCSTRHRRLNDNLPRSWHTLSSSRLPFLFFTGPTVRNPPSADRSYTTLSILDHDSGLQSPS